MINKEVERLFFIIIMILCFSLGCMTAVKKPTVKIDADKKIAVVPFMNYADELVSKAPDSEEFQVDDYLTDRLIKQLAKRKFNNITIMPKVAKKSEKVFLVDQIKKNIPDGTDILILNRIFRFRERRGRNYAVAAPASVALDIRLVDVVTGKVIHHYEYNETQRSLSENILKINEFIKRKGRWVQAIELADFGVSKGVEKITY